MKSNIKENLNNYLNIFKREEFNLLKKQLKDKEDIINRKNFKGHITASGFIINNNKVLLIFHNKLKKYIQPGGHLEAKDNTIKEAAQREVKEETALNKIVLHKWCLDNNCPIMIDTHLIPENKEKKEEEHYHHDFLYIFNTKDNNIILDLNEVSNFVWKDIKQIDKNNNHLLKAIKKMKEINLFDN